jgi:hypothetical protein
MVRDCRETNVLSVSRRKLIARRYLQSGERVRGQHNIWACAVQRLLLLPEPGWWPASLWQRTGLWPFSPSPHRQYRTTAPWSRPWRTH